MFKDIFAALQQTLLITNDVAQLKEQVRDLQVEMRTVIASLQALKAQVDQNQRDAEHKHEVLLLRIENAFLRGERSLGTAPLLIPEQIEGVS